MLFVLTMMDAVNLEPWPTSSMHSPDCLRSFLFFIPAQIWDGFLDVEVLVWYLMTSLTLLLLYWSWGWCWIQVVVKDDVDDGADGLHPYANLIFVRFGTPLLYLGLWNVRKKKGKFATKELRLTEIGEYFAFSMLKSKPAWKKYTTDGCDGWD